MMKSTLFNEAAGIWKKLAAGATEKDLILEIKIYQKLLSYFMPGDFYYYIFNVKDVAFDFMSSEITHVLGYNLNEIDVYSFINKIHPEDQPWFLNFENQVTDFFANLTEEQIPNYKVRYDYRIQKKNGDYIRILQQVVTIHWIKTKVLRTFGVHTDISHIKRYGLPVLSFIGLNGEPSYVNVKADKPFSLMAAIFTKRESEILHLLAEGKSSLEISRYCFISKQTVDTHRKNILKKTGYRNTSELVSQALKNGWI